MLRGLYTAYTGMLAQQQKMDTISNNLANVNTIGFKKDAAVFEAFEDVYKIKINDPEAIGQKSIGKGNLGVKVGEIYTDFTQGTFQQTDSPIDLALEGSGMFVIGVPNGDGELSYKYTRDGSFNMDSQGRLVTQEGFFLIGENGPITLANTNVRISEEGNIFSGAELADKVRIVDFENLNQLKKVGSNFYEASDTAGEKAFGGKVIQGFLESSNVSSMDEMIHMINVMRTYESNQKIITTYDTTLDKAVNEVGRV